jgi:cytochrome c oxidase assembly factor CtaG
MPLAPLTPVTALTTWQFAPLASALLALLAAAYLAGVCAVRRPGRGWPAGRTAAFLAGLAVIAVATQGSTGAYDDVLFSAHMVQHLLLIMVAPPLLVLGRPVTLLLHAARNPWHTRVKRVLRSPAVSFLTWPPFTVSLYAVVVLTTHLTPLMDLVLENEAAHDAEHAAYLVTGYLYFLPVIGSEPLRRRLTAFGRYLLLLVTAPVDLAAGVVLMLVPRELFPAYASADRPWGPSPLADLHAGGLIMIAGSNLVMTVVGVMLAVSLARAGERAGDMAGERAGGRGAARQPLPPGASRRPCGTRREAPTDLDAYNAYLGSLDGSLGKASRPARSLGKASRPARSPGKASRPARSPGKASRPVE